MNNKFQIIQKLHKFYPLFLDVGIAFAFSRLVFYVVVAVSILVIPEYSGNDYATWYTSAPWFIDASWRWDAGWYHAIAKEGYYLSEGQSSVGFFPLYPLLLRGISFLTSDNQIYWGGVLLNHVLFFSALIVVWLYSYKFGGRRVAKRTVLFLSIFPASFFFSAVYSESFYLLLATATLLLIQSNRFGNAAILGFFASLTRPTGLWLIIPYVINAWRLHSMLHNGWIRRWIPLLLIPAGTGLFMVFLTRDFGDPFLYVNAKEAWGQNLSFAPVSLYKSLQLFFNKDLNSITYFMNIVNTCAAIWALAMIVLLWRRNRAGATFALASVLTPLTFAVQDLPTTSMIRYVGVLSPLFLPMAEWGNTWWRQLIIVILFLSINVILTALFVRWYHVV